MRSVTSCFNLALYKKDLSRFWPLWTVYTVAWLFALPLSLLSERVYNSGFDPARWAGREPVLMVANSGAVIALLYGVVCAAAVWSYLYNNRSANLMHALPIRREGHFLCHTLAGITFFALPHVIVFVLTLLAELACGAVNVGTLAAAMGCQTLLTLFFFSFATLCGMFTGHILALPAFYGIFNLLVYVMSSLLDWLGMFFLYGFTGGLADQPFVKWLTPVEAIMNTFSYGYPTEPDPVTGELARVSSEAYFEGVGVLWIYAAVGLVLLAAALLLYRKRHLETAGDVVAVPFLRPVFLYCMGICGALAGGCATCVMLGLEGLVFLVVSLLVWGVIFYFAGLMLLQKSFRVFKQGWWGCGISLCVVLALCGVLQADLFGVEARVPDAADVAHVSVRGMDTFPNDTASYLRTDGKAGENPETIEKALAVHQAIVDEREFLWEWEEEFSGNGYELTGGEAELAEAGLAQLGRLYITYTLTNGRVLSREYNYLWLEYGDLQDPTSLSSRITALANDRAILTERYYMGSLAGGPLTSAVVEDSGTYTAAVLQTEDAEYTYRPNEYTVGTSGGGDYEKYLEEYGYYYPATETSEAYDPSGRRTVTAQVTDIPLSEEGAEAIRQAVLADFEAGNLGVRYLFNGSEERLDNTFVADLILVYETSYEERKSDGTRQTLTVEDSLVITLTPQAEATIAALKAAGAFESSGVELRTNGGDLYTP